MHVQDAARIGRDDAGAQHGQKARQDHKVNVMFFQRFQQCGVKILTGSPVPDSVRKALAISSNDPNAYGYPVTAGTADLRDAIHEWFAAARNVDLRAIGADAVPTVGSKEGVALMASLLHFGEGDVVVQPKVSYPTYEIGTQLAGAQTLKVDDVADADSWKDVPGVKAVWVNSPCNPTGEVLSAEQMAGIVRAARAIGAVVLSDECYALMQWEDDVAEADADTLASTKRDSFVKISP